MAEHIDREAAYDDFERCNSENPKWTPSRVKTLIARQKTADVAPVRHGRWVWKHSPYDLNIYICSVCKKQVSILGNKLRYCPNCGAIMDGGAENGR